MQFNKIILILTIYISIHVNSNNSLLYRNGTIKNIDSNEIVFPDADTLPKGNRNKDVLKTKIINNIENNFRSHIINEHDDLIINRPHTWEKDVLDTQPKPFDTLSVKNLSFLVGKWKAIAKDSSFTTILEYKYSQREKLLLATNQLFDKKGNLFADYEGVYLVEVDRLLYFIAGPKGETHRGYAKVNNNIVTHFANLYPGLGVKSYKSEMILKNGLLYYYANYSKDYEIPTEIEYKNALIYFKIE